jgi:hypothetical protein
MKATLDALLDRGPKKQRRMVAVILWKLTGKRKVAGRYFGETSLNWSANEDITNRQKDRGIMTASVIEIFSSQLLSKI